MSGSIDWDYWDPSVALLRRWLGVDDPNIDAQTFSARCDRYIEIIRRFQAGTSATAAAASAATARVPGGAIAGVAAGSSLFGWLVSRENSRTAPAGQTRLEAPYTFWLPQNARESIPYFGLVNFFTIGTQVTALAATGAVLGAASIFESGGSEQLSESSFAHAASTAYMTLYTAIAFLGAAGMERLVTNISKFKVCRKIEDNWEGGTLMSFDHFNSTTISYQSGINNLRCNEVSFYTSFGTKRSYPILFFLHVKERNFTEAFKFLRLCEKEKIDLHADTGHGWTTNNLDMLISNKAPASLIFEYLKYTNFKPTKKLPLDDKDIIDIMIRDIAWWKASVLGTPSIHHAMSTTEHIPDPFELPYAKQFAEFFTYEPRKEELTVRSDVAGDLKVPYLKKLQRDIYNGFNDPKHPLHKRCLEVQKEENDKIQAERLRDAERTSTVGGLIAYNEILQALELALSDKEKKHYYETAFKPALDALIAANDVTIISKRSALLQNIRNIAELRAGLSKADLTKEVFLDMLSAAADFNLKTTPQPRPNPKESSPRG